LRDVVPIDALVHAGGARDRKATNRSTTPTTQTYDDRLTVRVAAYAPTIASVTARICSMAVETSTAATTQTAISEPTFARTLRS
jgi:hypothetical protein